MKKEREKKKLEPETVHDDNDSKNDWINCKMNRLTKRDGKIKWRRKYKNINILLKNCAWSQRRDDDGDGNGISSNSNQRRQYSTLNESVSEYNNNKGNVKKRKQTYEYMHIDPKHREMRMCWSA